VSVAVFFTGLVFFNNWESLAIFHKFSSNIRVIALKNKFIFKDITSNVISILKSTRIKRHL